MDREKSDCKSADNETDTSAMSRTDSLNPATLLIASLLLAGFMWSVGEIPRSTLAQTLPPRPTLTSQQPTAPPNGGDHDEEDDEQATATSTSVATATPASTVSSTPT